MDDHSAVNRSTWNAQAMAYQERHSGQLDGKELAWGVWGLPESEIDALGDLSGKRTLEFGCGAAQWSILLARRGARCVSLDLSEGQLAQAERRVAAAGVDVALVHANAERSPFRDASFDVVFCDHGAMTFGDPRRTVPEAARLIRPGGRFVFNMASPLHDLFFDLEADAPADAPQHSYFELHRLETPGEVTFQLPYGEWLRLFRENDFEVLDLIELRPPPDATTTYAGFTTLERARSWPAENIWKLRRKSSADAP